MQSLLAYAGDLWPAVITVAWLVSAAWVTVDAALRKRHVPAAIGWIGLAWLAPVVGAFAYYLLGINRVRRAATALERRVPGESRRDRRALAGFVLDAECDAGRLGELAGLARLGAVVTGNPLLHGNRIEPLPDGDAAFPAMLAAIERARRSVTLVKYIFDNDAAGAAFRDALAAAVRRGVEVRVLVDDVGARYSRPTIVGALREAGVPVATFLPSRVPRLFHYANLRNHRKIMVVDGHVGFTGGMNIRAGHWQACKPGTPVQCVHFRVEGPIVEDLQATFCEDWLFATGERLVGPTWFAAVAAAGHVVARGVPDGPDADLDNLMRIMLGALAVARRRVRVVTPYFLPDEPLLRAMQVAALRGVEVDIVLPARSNVPVMDWAMAPQLPWLVETGCRVHRTPPPFDHSKLFVVDGTWSLIGSTNWDARSLRLNFEYNLECYDAALAARLDTIVDRKIAGARRMDGTEFARQPFVLRLRDALARLLSPYL
jgi:cardiolipin synthase